MKRSRLVLLALLFAWSTVQGQTPTERFETLVLSEWFHSEGAEVADLNGDGIADVISGPFWYVGPTFRVRHAYAEIKPYSIKAYSDHFFSFAQDFDGDGDTDLFSIPMPGTPGQWHENPGSDAVTGVWRIHHAIDTVDNESPTFADVTGDGVQELVCIHQGSYGYARPDALNPRSPWTFIPISENRGYGRFTHGLGVGDVDGDGKADLLEKDGWWSQTAKPGDLFQFHATKFAESGGSQMFAYDFDGDGDNDVLSVQNAHAYGLSWFEHQRSGDEISFVQHRILGNHPAENAYGLAISQMHAVALTDIDGDGIRDLVTGKRYWAHGGNDPGAAELPVLYWLRTVRTPDGVEFQPHLIDVRVGVGTQLTTADVDGNGHIDIVVGNKLGTFLMLNHGVTQADPQPSEVAAHRVGSDEFKNAVRTTEPLSPSEERDTFILPAGFEAQLVASEPDIAKPMNLAFDTRGRLWVSSSVEYPIPAPEGQGRDTIKILEDIDGDGRADKITTFADGLNVPIGLYPYRDGVICYSIPNIWFLRDTDGDDHCDTREILYGPFDYSRDTHGMCNGFTRGFDGWLYACHGFNNQSSVTGKDGHQVTMHSGNTFRIRLDGSRIEHFTDGQVNPFGMALDPNGDLFTADCHTKPISLLLHGGVYEGFGKPHDGLGFVPHVMEHLHGSTAIGGIAIYHDDRFPAAFQGNAFGGNVMTSRINRNSIHHIGSTVAAQEESDFLISGDPWFRPVDLKTGPDGALYVADFYNRIIGHYEVGLDHPGRDRHSGRVWRIVYNPNNTARRDFVSPRTHSASAAVVDDIANTIGRLKLAGLTERSSAADRLVDEFANSAIAPVRAALAEAQVGKTPHSDEQVQLLWVLCRLNAITDADVIRAAQDESPRVRAHAFQIIAAMKAVSADLESFLVTGLSDADAIVRRSAAMSAAGFPSQALTKRLLETLHQTAPSDLHLRHVIRMSLRDHLRDADHFHAITQSISDRDLQTVIDLCLGIKTEDAGQFLAANISKIQGIDKGQLSSYLTFAARYAPAEHLGEITQTTQQRFADDFTYQESLLRSIQTGLVQRGVETPEVVNDWAASLARHSLGIESDDDTLPDRPRTLTWSYQPYPGHPDQGNPWTTSTKRDSADGQRSSVLYSSFPSGETKTGIYRSEPFALANPFSFFIAGHDGFPGNPLQRLNHVQVRDAITHEILQTWSPPRNDVAQAVQWMNTDVAGRQVYVELVDGDTGTAYAWMAVGRFSVAGLNPNRSAEQYGKAAELIADFRLQRLAGPTQQILMNQDSSRENAYEFALTWAALYPSSTAAAIAEAIGVAAVDRPLRHQLATILTAGDNTHVIPSLGKVTQLATAAEQLRIATKLSSDQTGLETLLKLIEAGQASPSLLLDPAVHNKLDGISSAEQKQRSTELTKDLPAESPALATAIQSRKQVFMAGGGDAGSGLNLFTKHCAVCHQVAGKGVAVGPNLDGIGNRGLDRVLEDVFTPNRNVDAAFRASVVLTEDGQVYSGLIKRTDGTQVLIVDLTGKEINIAASEISQQKLVQSSPMPANFHETIDESQMKDLLAYLLSLTH